MAGPIVRYHDIALQLENRRVDLTGIAAGIRRLIFGLAKKLLIADRVAITADAIFSLPDDRMYAELAWLGALCYTLQIYFDFSGYSDIAIGIGKMLGFTFPENFRYPYLASSIKDFWRRWHISLSSWFRDYLYIPLGGKPRVVRPDLRELAARLPFCAVYGTAQAGRSSPGGCTTAAS